MKKSCGFLIQCQGKFLLCHATKPSGNINLDDGQWGIPKGGVEDGESEIETALRETYEETSLSLKESDINKTPICTYSTKTKKYIIFYCHINDPEIFKTKLKCITMIDDTDSPENDAFVWVEWDKAREIAIKNQKFNLFTKDVKEKILSM